MNIQKIFKNEEDRIWFKQISKAHEMGVQQEIIWILHLINMWEFWLVQDQKINIPTQIQELKDKILKEGRKK